MGLTPKEQQSAADYDDRTTAAVKAVLIEIGQILGGFKGKFAVIGGAVPWLLLDQQDMPHVGTLDVDLALDAEALGEGEYAALVEALLDHGYRQGEDLKKFQLLRRVPAGDGGEPVKVIVDFLMPRGAKVTKNVPPLIRGFAVQRADGADLGLKFCQIVVISGRMPAGGVNQVEIPVSSIPASLAMKGYALNGRYKRKDAYDVYFSVRNYPGGVNAAAEACRPLVANPGAARGYQHIADKFRHVDDYGPTSVRQFVEKTDILGDRTPEQWQQDAFGQVDAWLRQLGLRT